MIVENEYSKVKVNNEIDFCSVTDSDIKAAIEKGFMKARVSYFIRWDKPGFFSKIIGGNKTKMVFCINAAQAEIAEEVLKDLTEYEGNIKMLRTRSNNRVDF